MNVDLSLTHNCHHIDAKESGFRILSKETTGFAVCNISSGAFYIVFRG
ncbi:hypothetical protein T05_2148 [Trichinella murrelli]|uniref:Uncharacterized protein n=1 Tax=Trichinella murrelli TaxID=144512 RepID=A0A0V0SYP5_9BILA|nr:hypothetical protein T05_2148 [Trichinella murrelli]